ncbi:glycosyltransferase [Marinobacter shengliensis]|uniref:glycosyltransferase n=1 Tax=Marinobacter shengliensis TaxID=1389223 RepID=UPI000D1035D1|nr:glycosyltransferase [Marinobacter shengliensis]PSF12977.1 rhamnosyltransferase [Marinobacter shengliensis]
MIDNVSKALRVACIVPTYNGREDFKRLFDSLSLQTECFDLLVVDSSSTDGTSEFAEALRSQGEIKHLLIIPGAEFNHGGTRQKMVDDFPEYDVYVFLTQDAYLEDKDALKRILSAFSDPLVAAVCGRQLPHHDASPLAEHARLFNYPSVTQVKSKADIRRLGIKAAFMSNSFAAYRGDLLRAVGGFPKHVIFAEDMFVAAKMLLEGFKVVYAGDACCRHSHNYTALEEFRRYFDMGVFHAREPWIREEFGGAGGEGVKFAKSELRFLGVSKIYLWPAALIRNLLKLFAYKFGQHEDKFPIAIKRRIGMYKGYWNGPFAEKKG